MVACAVNQGFWPAGYDCFYDYIYRPWTKYLKHYIARECHYNVNIIHLDAIFVESIQIWSQLKSKIFTSGFSLYKHIYSKIFSRYNKIFNSIYLARYLILGSHCSNTYTARYLAYIARYLILYIWQDI